MNRSWILAAPIEGGVGHVASRLAAEWGRRGCAPEFVTLSDEGACAWRALALAVRHRTRIRDATVVHIELGRTARGAFWFLVGCLILKARCVVTLHDVPWTAKCAGSALMRCAPGLRDVVAHRILCAALNRTLDLFVRRRVAATVVLGTHAREVAQRRGWPSIAVVSHGADGPLAVCSPGSCTRVVFAGYVTATKGLDTLMAAWARTVRPGWSLRIVGSVAPGMRAVLDSVLEGAGLADAALAPVWTGYVDEADFIAEIASAGIVVLPYTESNPASGVLVRAMVEGRAVIASRVEATREVGESGEAILLFDSGDVDVLVDQLDRLMSNPSARNLLGAAAARVARRHSWSEQADELSRVHVAVMERR